MGRDDHFLVIDFTLMDGCCSNVKRNKSQQDTEKVQYAAQ